MSTETIEVIERSLFEFSEDELEIVKLTGVVPAGTNLDGIQNHHMFDRLFKHRMKPAAIADILLQELRKNRPKPGRITSESSEFAGAGTGNNPNSHHHKYKEEKDRMPGYQAVIDPELRKRKMDLKERELEMKKAKYATSAEICQRLIRIEEKLDLLIRTE